MPLVYTTLAYGWVISQPDHNLLYHSSDLFYPYLHRLNSESPESYYLLGLKVVSNHIKGTVTTFIDTSIKQQDQINLRAVKSLANHYGVELGAPSYQLALVVGSPYEFY